MSTRAWTFVLIGCICVAIVVLALITDAWQSA